MRLFRTRSAATVACRGGHVRLNDAPGKASSEVKPGDTVRVRLDQQERIVEVVDAALAKRVGASLARLAYVDHTPAKPAPIPQMTGRVAVRDRGSGRPTKRERRDLERLRGRPESPEALA